eukprot:762153_1
MADANTENATVDPTKALSVDATDINVQNSGNTDESNQTNKLSSLANEAHEQETQPPSTTTTEPPQQDQKPETTEYKQINEEEKQPSVNKSALSNQYTQFETDEAKQYQITGSFRDNWEQYCCQPSITSKVTTHEGKEEVIHFANPLA